MHLVFRNVPTECTERVYLIYQWRIQTGFRGFHGTPVLKGCLGKYYAQTYYVHYAHTGATHFTSTVAIMYMCQLLYQEFDTRMAYMCTYILPEAHGNHRDNASELKLIHALLPLQLGMAICYQYESAYFPMSYVDNQLLCSLCGPKQSRTFNSAGFKHNNQV